MGWNQYQNISGGGLDYQNDPLQQQARVNLFTTSIASLTVSDGTEPVAVPNNKLLLLEEEGL